MLILSGVGETDFKWIWNCDMAKRFESTSFKDHMRINHFPNSFEVLIINITN